MLTYEQGIKTANEMFVLGSFEDFSLDEIIEVLRSADDLYTNDGESFLNDDQYDALKQYAHMLAPAHVYFTGVGSAVRGGKVKLPYKMGSLNQVYAGDFVKWVAKYNLSTEFLVLSDKLDGASALLAYGTNGDLQIAYSRGDGFEGADISRHVRQMNVPKFIQNDTGAPVAIRAENIISKPNFKKANNGKLTRNGRIYKNARNMVSGLMNASENNPEIYQYIDTVAYEIVGSTLSKNNQLVQLNKWGFNVVRYRFIKAGEHNDDTLTTILNDRRANSVYELDGVVIDVDDIDVRTKMKTEELNPEYAVKFKIADASNLAIATVRNVEWNISKDGYYKPRVQINPIDLVGVTISNLTGFNAKFIKDNGIGPGAEIRITRSGDVIPFILGTTKPVQPQLPSDATAVWTETGVDLVVNGANENETVRFERLLDFFMTIDAPLLKEGNLRMMFDAGFETPESIIELTQEDISSLVGSAPIGKKIFTGLRAQLTDIPLYVLMGAHPALGRGVGIRKMKKLYEAFEGDMTLCKFPVNIKQVDGFDDKTANKIAGGFDDFFVFYENIKPYVKLAKYEAKKSGTMSGQIVVFTGFRSKDLEAAVEEQGGKMGSSVSSKTTLLVAEDKDSMSGKAIKARELGIKVIGVKELNDLLGVD